MAKRKPNLFEGIAGFGTSYMMGATDGWAKLKKDEKDAFKGSFWNYLKRDRDGTQPLEADKAPVVTPTVQSNPAQETYTPSLTEMEDASKKNDFGQSAPVQVDGSTETYAVPSQEIEEKPIGVSSFEKDFLNKRSPVDTTPVTEWKLENTNGS